MDYAALRLHIRGTGRDKHDTLLHLSSHLNFIRELAYKEAEETKKSETLRQGADSAHWDELITEIMEILERHGLPAAYTTPPDDGDPRRSLAADIAEELCKLLPTVECPQCRGSRMTEGSTCAELQRGWDSPRDSVSITRPTNQQGGCRPQEAERS